MSPRNPGEVRAPLVVRTHVTPWGFAVALPLALAFAFIGARSLDAQIVPSRLASLGEPPLWLFAAILIGFALFLFLIGVAELAHYLKPAVEVVIDQNGVTTWGVLGERRIAWGDIIDAEVDESHLELKARGRSRGPMRGVRLQFSRLAVEPAALVQRIREHRPDLEPRYRTG
jgi:hypothetical protein